MVKASIIIPVFNTEKFLGRCLRSALHQSLPRVEYEIIVVNDGSTDKSQFIIDQFGDDIISLNNVSNIGLTKSLNKAIKKSRGKYIVRLDSDDYVNEHYMLFLTELMLANPDRHLGCCDYFRVCEERNKRDFFSFLDDPIGCATIFSNSILNKVGLYSEKILIHEDSDMFLKVTQHDSFIHLPMPLYRYRYNPNSLTSSLN
jgi:glycosyltransferase involved in cell wall biosynthesis